MKVQVLSLREVYTRFPDAEAARAYLEGRRWPEGARCPTCGSGERITPRAGGYYRCGACVEDFTVRTGTVFERSHVPLNKWLYSMYFLVTARKGISSLQLSKEIGITQKSAWFVLQRLREACGPGLEQLQGIVEMDEAYIGGKEKAKHESKRLHAGRGAVGKTAVIRPTMARLESFVAATIGKRITYKELTRDEAQDPTGRDHGLGPAPQTEG